MPTLHLVHDPMCSWCYAFAPNWRQIKAALPASISVQYVLGGLAPDSDQPMPLHVQGRIHLAHLHRPGLWSAARTGGDNGR